MRFSAMIPAVLMGIASLTAQEPPPIVPVVEVEEVLYDYESADNGAGPLWCHGSTCLVRIGDEVFHTAGEGNGPVNALDTALRKALFPKFPDISNFHLVDYKVRILDSENATGATTRVLIDTQNGKQRWSTVGASTNIIEASWLALADSFEYGLITSSAEGSPKGNAQ